MQKPIFQCLMPFIDIHTDIASLLRKNERPVLQHLHLPFLLQLFHGVADRSTAQIQMIGYIDRPHRPQFPFQYHNRFQIIFFGIMDIMHIFLLYRFRSQRSPRLRYSFFLSRL